MSSQPGVDAKPHCQDVRTCQGKTVEGMRCRRQLKKHGEGIVCKTCHGSTTFIECKNACGNVIHSGCFTSNGNMITDRSIWTCLTCSIISDPSTTAPIAAIAPSESSTIPPIPLATSVQTGGDESDHSTEANLEVDDTTFEDHADMVGTLGSFGFKRYHIQRNAKKHVISYSWKCKCVLRCTTIFIIVMISFRYGTCHDRIHCKLVGDNVWSTQSLAATSHACCPAESSGTQSVLLKKTYQLSKYSGLLRKIQELGATKSFTPKEIQHHIQTLPDFSGALVDTCLIQRIGNKAREEVFGPGCSDTAHLIAKQKDIEAAGGTYDLIYDKTDTTKLIGIIWVAPYCHLLIPHFADCFGSDGTHGMSK